MQNRWRVLLLRAYVIIIYIYTQTHINNMSNHDEQFPLYLKHTGSYIMEANEGLDIKTDEN